MMHLSLCTISFRHQLVSLPELATFAVGAGLDGIELWAAHARSLKPQPGLNGDWLDAMGLGVSMLSDYLPFAGPYLQGREKLRELCILARHWNTRKIRVFAGKKASAECTAADWHALVCRLRDYCFQAEEAGMTLLLETHPYTGADTTEATEELLVAVDHPALKVNLDVLHIWEAGEDPVRAWRRLAPQVQHLHLKNIRHRQYLPEFAPDNVYSAAGSRAGMVPLFEGACDFAHFLHSLPGDRVHSASLEWFGPDPLKVIARDSQQIRRLQTERLCEA